MAIWQFECKIIPKRDNIGDMNSDEIISWRDVKCSLSDISFLPHIKSWSNNIQQFGELEKDCLEFVFDGTILEEITCRLDLRTFSVVTFKNILEYVNKINAVFWYGEKMYFPVEEDILIAIIESTAYRFCSNPKDYLDEIRKNSYHK